MPDALEEKIIIELCNQPNKNRKILDSIKRQACKKSKAGMPKNSALLKAYHRLAAKKRISKNIEIENVLRTRSIRSLSGIVIVSVLTKPYPCPGKCIYCPNQKNAPKSYLKEEPAVARAINLNYNPYQQVQTRIKVLQDIGHPTDKIDLRIIGGTWSYYPKQYQIWFIKQCFRATLNPSPFKRGREGRGLKKLQRQNERAKHRIIGITIETRPDYINKKEVKRLRMLGITRVELGVQSIYDDVLLLNKRGHNIAETIRATRLLKNAGIKVCYQVMPNLAGSNPKKDIAMFKQLFSNENFQPDYLKIYPCSLLKETSLYNLWKKGKYKPYSLKKLERVIIQIKKTVPYYCRIQRIIRDIPSSYIVEGGTKTSNLRQIIAKLQKEQGWRCKCIRCREVKENYLAKEKLCLFRQDYQSSGGKEIFLSYENKQRTRLYSLLRLHIPSQYFSKEKHFLPVLNNAAIIRELHTYGQLVPIAQKQKAAQHKGLGKKLMKKAEKIAKEEFGLKKIAVISGVGVRQYYRKLGYRLKETYMIKSGL
jgi:elongator complex protein 3